MTDSEQVLRTSIREIVGEILRVPLDPTQDDAALADLYEQYDSLAVIDSVAGVELRTGVSIDLVEDDLRVSFASITSILELVRRKHAAASVLESDF
ncbi:hypothetical protein [Streptomyces sp. NBC_00151]|uniref:hypothetical protein n=1 Tax=Streptomyces sp. NBC_00151 TaxID=2975669 RepID=UPI002DDBB202|nr:hypothetical protein [Streptomyces sp. NBC_00151]WRZ37325.1 hypothetical protein OG915_04185 [Streptomyces sp. NBC_00151]